MDHDHDSMPDTEDSMMNMYVSKKCIKWSKTATKLNNFFKFLNTNFSFFSPQVGLSYSSSGVSKQLEV